MGDAAFVVDAIFHALGDSTRRAILTRVSEGPVAVSELAKPFKVSLVAVIQHVEVLEKSGLLKTEKIGRVRTCRLNPPGLAAAEKWLYERKSLWEKRYDRLQELLDEEEG